MNDHLSTSNCISDSVGGAVLPTRAEANQVTLSTRTIIRLEILSGMDEWTGPYACCDFEAASNTRASLSSRAPARRKRCASRLFSCSELPVFFPWRFLEICFWTFESATGIMARGKADRELGYWKNSEYVK